MIFGPGASSARFQDPPAPAQAALFLYSFYYNRMIFGPGVNRSTSKAGVSSQVNQVTGSTVNRLTNKPTSKPDNKSTSKPDNKSTS